MGSFTQLTYHVVFGTKYRRRSIGDPIRERLYTIKNCFLSD
jgi:REP element-mobilizing transposase RayT